jgi:uncharacterized alkaline shock family protein YloU
MEVTKELLESFRTVLVNEKTRKLNETYAEIEAKVSFMITADRQDNAEMALEIQNLLEKMPGIEVDSINVEVSGISEKKA